MKLLKEEKLHFGLDRPVDFEGHFSQTGNSLFTKPRLKIKPTLPFLLENKKDVVYFAPPQKAIYFADILDKPKKHAPLKYNTIIPFSDRPKDLFSVKPNLGNSSVISDDFSTINVKSIVKDSLGNILPNASISILNTNKGTTTNFETGSFAIKTKPTDVLQVQFLGYNPVTIQANKVGSTIILQENSEVLDEIVVYGTKKKDNTFMYVGIGVGVLALGTLLFAGRKKGLKAVNVTI